MPHLTERTIKQEIFFDDLEKQNLNLNTLTEREKIIYYPNSFIDEIPISIYEPRFSRRTFHLTYGDNNSPIENLPLIFTHLTVGDGRPIGNLSLSHLTFDDNGINLIFF
jgi:hypothetical protein